MGLSLSEVQAMLKAEKEAALGVSSGALSDDRQKALDYYQGEMEADLPSVDGRSSAVSTGHATRRVPSKELNHG